MYGSQLIIHIRNLYGFKLKRLYHENIYCRYHTTFGDDYFSFWAGGVFFIVINSQYFYDGSKVPEITGEHNKWIDEQLKFSSQSKHGAVIFQHIPWFLEDPETEEESYFFLKKNVRKPMLEKLYKNG